MRQLNSLFENFRRNIEPTQSQKNRMISSHKHLRENILNQFNYVDKTILTGSYKRNTMIRPLNDVDVFVLLNSSEEYNTPQSVLNKLKRNLRIYYPNSFIKQDKPCVVLDFNHCTFELTPAIEKTNFWGNKIYCIPNYNNLNCWIQVEDPLELGNKLGEANRNNNGMLTPLVKMMKHCKKFRGETNLLSFQMELKAINAFSSSWSRLDNYRQGVTTLLYEYDWITWHEQNRIKRMSDYDFTKYCRDYLFGYEFPIN